MYKNKTKNIKTTIYDHNGQNVFSIIPLLENHDLIIKYLNVETRWDHLDF